MRKYTNKTPFFLFGIWLCFALSLFMFTLDDDIYLIQSANKEYTVKPRKQVPVVVHDQPTLNELFAEVPVISPPLENVQVNEAYEGDKESLIVSPPSFELKEKEFEVTFTINTPKITSHTSFQKEPPALMIDLPGKWKRDFKEEFTFNHSLIRKVRFMVLKDKLTVKLYYTNKKTQKQGNCDVQIDKNIVRITAKSK